MQIRSLNNVSLFGFNGVSTVVGYLMPNPFYTNKLFYFYNSV